MNGFHPRPSHASRGDEWDHNILAIEEDTGTLPLKSGLEDRAEQNFNSHGLDESHIPDILERGNKVKRKKGVGSQRRSFGDQKNFSVSMAHISLLDHHLQFSILYHIPHLTRRHPSIPYPARDSINIPRPLPQPSSTPAHPPTPARDISRRGWLSIPLFASRIPRICIPRTQYTVRTHL